MQEEIPMMRWRQMFRQERKESLRNGMTEEQANDRGQVAAWLDNLARTHRLRVERYIEDGFDRIVRHRVHILDREDDTYAVKCGGSLDMSKLVWGEDWPFRTYALDNHWYMIELMITDVIPEHEMFKRPDGSKVDLGFNGKNHQLCSFVVEIHDDELVGDF